MNKVNIDLIIEDKIWKKEKEINKKLIKNGFLLVVEYLGIKLKSNNEISITLSNDEYIKKLNNKYREKDSTTNVLTFSLYNNINNIKNDNLVMPFIALGDIVFAYDTICKEAHEQNKSFINHFIHLLIHSILHLFAFDHIKENDRKKMEKIEIEILQAFNIDNPYIID